MSLPSKMKVIKSLEAKKAAVVDASLPELKPEWVLVKTSAVALNPTDWKHIDFISVPNATVGCDFAGTVVDIGSKVTKSLKPGDRVAGVVHGVSSNSLDNGSFGEYCVAKGDILLKVPDAVSDEQAATLGVGISTIGQGLYQSLELPMPDQPAKEPFPVLIYGASTATGLFAVQWAKLSGLTVIGTSSPRNFDLVKSYGADAVFDYSDPETCAKNIREYTNNSLKYAFDCISEHSSPQICANALSTTGGHYSSLLPVKFPTPPGPPAKTGYTLAYTCLGEPFSFRGGKEFAASTEDYEHAKKVWALAEKLLAEGKFRVPPLREGKGGLEGVLQGLEELRQGRVSGEKLVYRV